MGTFFDFYTRPTRDPGIQVIDIDGILRVRMEMEAASSRGGLGYPSRKFKKC